jgi:hypothetical protein
MQPIIMQFGLKMIRKALGSIVETGRNVPRNPLTFYTLFPNGLGREQGKSQSFAMRKNKLVLIAALLVAMTASAPKALALSAAQASAIKKAVTSVAVPEMPAKAAELVVKASKEDREAVALTAVRAAIYKNRSAAAAVVAAVAKVAPDLAPSITLAATQMERDQVSAIASAAITAAPSARVEITSSANTGLQPQGTSVVPQASPMSANGIVRGSAANPQVITVTQSDTPISPTGGNGSGSYTGSNPVGAGGSTVVDYTRPRNL